MDDKITNNLDNLNVEETEKLIGSIDTGNLGEKIDENIASQIKASVMEKAEFGCKNQNSPYSKQTKVYGKVSFDCLNRAFVFHCFCFYRMGRRIYFIIRFAHRFHRICALYPLYYPV